MAKTGWAKMGVPAEAATRAVGHDHWRCTTDMLIFMKVNFDKSLHGVYKKMRSNEEFRY